MVSSLILVYDHPLPNSYEENAFLIDLHGSLARDHKDSSILVRIIQEHKLQLRDELLTLIHRLGKPFLRELEIEPGLSYWWCCSLSETAPFKDPFVYKIILVLALRHWINANEPERIVLYTSDDDWAEVIGRLCHFRNIPFQVHREKKEANGEIQKQDWVRTNPLGSAIHHFLKRLSYSRFSFPKAPKPLKKAIICYFPNFSSHHGGFQSRYLEEVSELLNQNEIGWIFFYVGALKKFREPLEKISNFQNLNYQFLDQQFSLWELPTLLYRFFKLQSRFLALWKRSDFLKNEEIDIRTLAGDSLRESFCFHLLDLLIRQSQIQRFLHRNPALETLYYLMENQPWEQVLLYETEKREIQTRGIIHSTISDLKLNYFQHPQSYPDFRLPTQILVNGESSKNAFRSQGVEANRLVEIEAQRYLYLENAVVRKPETNSAPILLVTTSYDLRESELLLRFLEEASIEKIGWERIWIKAHPFQPVTELIEDMGSFPDFEMKEEPVRDLLPQASASFTTITGSVLVESLHCGLPTLSFLCLEVFPMPAIDAHPCLRILSSPQELSQSLNDLSWSKVPSDGKSYFYLDSNLPRWKDLVSQSDEETMAVSSSKLSK